MFNKDSPKYFKQDMHKNKTYTQSSYQKQIIYHYCNTPLQQQSIQQSLFNFSEEQSSKCSFLVSSREQIKQIQSLKQNQALKMTGEASTSSYTKDNFTVLKQLKNMARQLQTEVKNNKRKIYSTLKRFQNDNKENIQINQIKKHNFSYKINLTQLVQTPRFQEGKHKQQYEGFQTHSKDLHQIQMREKYSQPQQIRDSLKFHHKQVSHMQREKQNKLYQLDQNERFIIPLQKSQLKQQKVKNNQKFSKGLEEQNLYKGQFQKIENRSPCIQSCIKSKQKQHLGKTKSKSSKNILNRTVKKSISTNEHLGYLNSYQKILSLYSTSKIISMQSHSSKMNMKSSVKKKSF